MLIQRFNSRGGRPLKPNHFPLHQDKEGNFGFLIGYDKGGDKMLIPISLAQQIADCLGSGVYAFNKKLKTYKPHVPWKKRLAIWLLGKKEARELEEQLEAGD